jgi:hypothetical protein
MPQRPREADGSLFFVACVPLTAYAELPYGWTVAWDPECGEYFCDHISKKYTKRHPRTGLILPWPVRMFCCVGVVV